MVRAEPAQQLRPIPDLLAKYDCERAGTASQGYAQYVAGQFVEWTESYSFEGETKNVHCVRQTSPIPATLTQSEAASFIEMSRGIGDTPPSDSKPRERGQDTPNRSTVDEMIRKAIPAPVLQPRSSDTSTPGSEGKASLQDLIISPGPEPQGTLVALTQSSMAGAPEYSVVQWADVRQHFRDHALPNTANLSSPNSESHRERPVSSRPSERQQTIGVDERARSTMTSFPDRVVGKLYSEYPNGDVTTCSATLVSPYVAVTAGHCLHARDRGGYATRALFIPAQSQSAFGGIVTYPYSYKFVTHVNVNPRWTQISGGTTINVFDARYDYGAVYFNTPWSYTTTFAPMIYGTTFAASLNIGYPGQVQGTNGNEGGWYDLGSEALYSFSSLRSYQVREFELDISGGNSGGPYFALDGSNYVITGIVSYGGDDRAGGVWLGGANESAFRGFGTWTPSSASPTQIANDLRAPIILSSNVAKDGASYLRFFNNSPSSGTVTVRFYDEAGVEVGVWISPTIPPLASRQFAVSDIEKAANIRVGATKLYSAKISSTFRGLFQHVAWNVAGQGLTNLSGCNTGLSNNTTAAINVHSSRLNDDYPSYIVLHSLSQQITDISADVFDSRTGIRLGGVTFRNVPANASGLLDIDKFEIPLKYSPLPDQYHYNIVLTGNTAAYIQHQVDNLNAGLLTNMTGTCTL